MACGCTDRLNMINKRLDNNTQLTNNKTLSLYSMASMSIDEIINLYRQGYTLEERSIENDDYINSLSYATECSGTATVDKSNTISGSETTLGMPHAIAQKFTPTSLCLQSVTIRAKQEYSNTTGLDVYITQDVSGQPSNSNWMGSRLAKVSKAYDQVPTAYTDLNFVLNLKLNNLNPLWIVVTPSIYDPVTDTGLFYIDLEGPNVDIATSTTALKRGTGNWSLRPGDSLVYKTWKTTYAPLPVLTSIVVSPASAPANVGSSSQLTATCKDQNTSTMTCPALTWTSSDTSKATVDSSGLVTGVASGTTNITASSGPVTSNSSTITVSSVTPVLTSIVVSPASASASVGSMTQLTAICKDQNDSTITCSALTWSSSNTLKATVDSTGRVTGVAAGTAGITARHGSVISNSSTITVPSVDLVLTSISPATVTLLLNATKQFVAKDQYTNEINTGVTWAKIIGVGSIDTTTGLYSAGATAGTAMISATYSDVSITAQITVSVTPPATEGGSGALIGILGVAALGIMMTSKKS